MLCGTECKNIHEYFVEYWQSHGTLLWIWIMLCDCISSRWNTISPARKIIPTLKLTISLIATWQEESPNQNLWRGFWYKCIIDVPFSFEGHFTTLELEGPWPMIYKLCDWSRSWRRSKFTLHQALKVSKTKEIWMDEKSNMMILHDTKWTMVHDLPYVALGPSKGGGSNAIKLLLAPRKYYSTMVGTQTQTYVAVLQHGPLSMYTKLEGPTIAKLDFYFPRLLVCNSV